MVSVFSTLLCGALLGFLSTASICSGQSCSSFSQCRDCISSSENCVWCQDESFTGSSRCYSAGDSVTCTNVTNPTFSSTVVRNELFSGDNQLMPQALQVNIRAGQAQTFPFAMRLSPVFPLDVYFLMDFSFSMRVDLNTLRNAAGDIIATIESITDNFQVGFGSFVDKPTHPYVLQGSDTIAQMCIDRGDCQVPYVFRNHQSLTSNSTDFVMSLASAQISANYDGPEATLDAMAQVLACKSQIGWRAAPARHMLIIISDASFHVAGDGKLGAAVRRFPGSCFLDGDLYTGVDSVTYDYPSVGQVARLLREVGVIPIFMITRNEAVKTTYSSLIKAFDRGTFSVLMGGTNEVNQQIIETYNNISAAITLESTVFEGLNVSIVMDCVGGGAIPGSTPNGCNRVSVGQNITFTVSVVMDKCTPELENGVLLQISNVFTGSIELNLTGLCSCECESGRDNNSTLCSSMGDRVCGACICNAGRYGRTCRCIDTNIDDGVVPSDACPIATNGMECSGRGDCNCGTCMCSLIPLTSTRYSGDVCECDDVNCPSSNNMTCSGRGDCVCGRCQCDNEYQGASCECDPPSSALCTKPGDSQPCSGRGTCSCAGCGCSGTMYRGDFCDTCSSVATCTGDETCANFDQCVRCVFVVTDSALSRNSNANCSVPCQSIDNIIQVSSVDQIPSDNRVLSCTSPLSGAQCIVMYVFTVTATTRNIYVISNLQDCLQIPIWAIAIAIFIAFVILAIILIFLVRLIIYVLDWKEYKKFQKDVDATHFGDTINPLYHRPETEHANPLFAGKNLTKESSKEPSDLGSPEKKPL